MPKPPTLFRAIVLSLARIGLDIRPAARRFRNGVLRPYRAEVTAQFEQIELTQRRLEEDVASLRNHTTFLERELAQAQSISNAKTATLEQKTDALEKDSAALQRQTARSLHDTETRLSALATALRSAAAERGHLHDRIFMLEQLLTGTAAARPPGALKASAGLASPAVAVILPTYNRGGFIAEAIASVAAQSFPHWELMVIDDGSTDGTAAIVAPYLADSRIRYLAQPKAGSATARNRGIAETSAPLIAYLDSDNLWYPDFLSRAVDCLATLPETDLVYGALVTQSHGLDRRCILWTKFDRDALLAGNFIDTNTIVHRRDLVARYGGWDQGVHRLVDWDLVLRYTAEKPARPLAVLAAYYRDCDNQRVTNTAPFGPAATAIQRKWFPPATAARRPRVLYVFWHYPQLSESYHETEILCMKAWGVHIEVWRTSVGASPYPINVPIHQGSLAEAIAAARPDVIHVHWISFALSQQTELAASGLPVTLRMHGFDLTRESLVAWLAHDWVAGVYAFPNQISQTGATDARVKPMAVAFDTLLFKPLADKDRRLVVRTTAGLASKDLEIFFEAARLLPEYRFVLAAVTCHDREEYIDYLQALNARMGAPVDLRIDVPRDAVAGLVAEAGIYLHTMHRMGAHAAATPVGQPISIAEAMATGCYCLVRDEPDLAAMVEGAGASYRDLDQLVGLIRATQTWTDRTWTEVQHRSIDRAYRRHADVTTLQPLFNDWVELAERSREREPRYSRAGG